MNYVLGGGALLALIFWIYTKIDNYLTDRKLVAQRAKSNQEFQAYVAETNRMKKEIEDAKLTYNINKRKLDSDTNPSNKP